MAPDPADGIPAAPRPIHYLVLIIAQAAVASAAILARAGLKAGLTPLSLSAWRLTVASLLLLIGLRASRTRRGPGGTSLDKGQAAGLLVAGILLGLHFALWFASLERITVARSTLLVATTPLWTGLGGLMFLRERPPPVFWLGLLVAAAGSWVVSGDASAHDGALMGDLLAVGGAMAIAAYLLIAQRVQPRLGSARMVAWTYSLAAITLWPMALMSAGTGLLPHSRGAWLSIVGMALGPQLIGHTAFNWSLRHFSAQAVAASTLTEPVFAGALAWWLLAEPVSAHQAAGAAMVLLGVGFALRRT